MKYILRWHFFQCFIFYFLICIFLQLFLVVPSFSLNGCHHLHRACDMIDLITKGSLSMSPENRFICHAKGAAAGRGRKTAENGLIYIFRLIYGQHIMTLFHVTCLLSYQRQHSAHFTAFPLSLWAHSRRNTNKFRVRSKKLSFPSSAHYKFNFLLSIWKPANIQRDGKDKRRTVNTLYDQLSLAH